MGAAKSKIDERNEANQRKLAAELKKQIEIESNATYYEKKWMEEPGDIYVLLRDTSKTEYKINFDFDAADPLAPEPIGQLTELAEVPLLFEPKGTTESTVKVSHEYTWPSPTGALAPLSRIWTVTRFVATVSFPDKLRSNSSKTDYANHESAILPGLGSTYTLKRAFAKGDAARILERMSWKTLTKRIEGKLNAEKIDFQRLNKDKNPTITRFELWRKTLTPAQKAFFATPESTAAVMVAYIKGLFSAAVRLTLEKRVGTK